MHCGYNQDSVTCFTSLTSQINFYRDGVAVKFGPHLERTPLTYKYRLTMNKHVLSTKNWTIGAHLLEARFNNEDLIEINCTNQLSYSTVIFKEGR